MMRMAAFSGQQQQQRDTRIRLPSILIQFSSRGLSWCKKLIFEQVGWCVRTSELSTNLREVLMFLENVPTFLYRLYWTIWSLKILKAACLLCFKRPNSPGTVKLRKCSLTPLVRTYKCWRQHISNTWPVSSAASAISAASSVTRTDLRPDLSGARPGPGLVQWLYFFDS